jgi:hypothetical protein
MLIDVSCNTQLLKKGLSYRGPSDRSPSCEPQERKELIQGFVHQVNVQRETSRMYADCWLHKIPLAFINKPAGHPLGTPG